MRLLQRSPGSDDFSLVERFGGDIPPYAILSHTWGSNEDEVTFLGLRNGQAKNIPGYSKLVFCSQQAARDNLEFFWVDTCCIDKSSSAELSEAINSMFKWYQKAEKCYVLLSDVAIDIPVEDISQQQWEQMFQNSRWFQRGWTLQEMLAPKVVEFFSKSGTRLGDKVTLLQALHRRTQVPVLALQGSPLSQFSIDDRMSWMKGRQTKREEDAAYSLLGLLGVHMSLLYGEGRERALARLRRKAERSLDDRAPAKPPASRPWTVPYRRNNDFINSDCHRDCVEKVCQVCSQPAGYATLPGPAGVGKTQVAIEYAYRVRDQTPTKWVFWINAATRATFEEGYRVIAAATGINTVDDPRVDILALVRRWLRDEFNGQWTIVVDNVEDTAIFFSCGVSQDHATASPDPTLQRLSNLLPQSPNGSILAIARNKSVARRIRDTYTNNVVFQVKPMDTDDAQASLRPFRCDIPGCTNKKGFARFDQLERHKATTRHLTPWTVPFVYPSSHGQSSLPETFP